jgi:hypothetical protein
MELMKEHSIKFVASSKTVMSTGGSSKTTKDPVRPCHKYSAISFASNHILENSLTTRSILPPKYLQ